MGLFSKKKKGSKKKGNGSEALLKEQRESPPPPLVAEPPIRTFDTLQKQVQPSLLGDDSSLEDVYVPDNKVYTTQPPPAREAAFHGPPRFDWIDIVRLDCFYLYWYLICLKLANSLFVSILGNQCGS
jgi:hypothetical protein